jgi:Fur family peroxide stress response transcriptional regulator
VQELGFSDRSARYDPNNSPHVNVICPKCGKIYDYEAKNIKELWAEIVAEIGVTPLQQRLDVYALCGNCKTKTET